MLQKYSAILGVALAMVAMSALPARGQGVAPLGLKCPAATGFVGVPYSSSLVATGGVTPYYYAVINWQVSEFDLNLSDPNLLTGLITGTPFQTGTFNLQFLVGDTGGTTVYQSCSITISNGPPPPVCTTGLQSITDNLSEKSKNGNEIVWFNSHFKLKGTLPSTNFTVNVTNGTIQSGPSTLTVPNATITFSSSAICASTSFDTTTNTWLTTLPLSAAQQPDKIFAAGLAYVLPSGFAKDKDTKRVTWTADYTASVDSLQFQVQWGAANYVSSDSNGDVFPMSGGVPAYNAMMIDPAHNVPSCAGYNTGDQAGTPENPVVKRLVFGGGSEGGGSNWTGSWSPSRTFVCK